MFLIRSNQAVASVVPRVRMRIERPSPGIQTASVSGEAVRAGSAGAQTAGFASALREEQEKAGSGRPPEKTVEHTIKEKDTIWGLAVNRYHVNPEDILRDNGIEDPRKIRPGQKIRIRLPSYPERTDVVASWYGSEYHGKPMANGKAYDMNASVIAHKDLPLGTRVELENPLTKERVRAVVADRGPYVEGRDVDLSYGLAKKLSMVEKGVGPLVMRVLR